MGSVILREELVKLMGRSGRGSRRVVFTNGCFDLLHPGHIRSLECGRSLGDVLAVGINSDDSVRRLKGTGRPIICEQERAEVLASLEAVDFVVIFNEPTPLELIAALLPDVLFKGADWGTSEVVGRQEVESAGGQVVSVPLEPGYSTTCILEKVRHVIPESSGPKPEVPDSSTTSSSAPQSSVLIAPPSDPVDQVDKASD